MRVRFTGRLANEGVKKSGGVSVKNGELSEDVRNVLSTSSFSPFSERTPILAGICTAAKRISFGSFSLCNRKENEHIRKKQIIMLDVSMRKDGNLSPSIHPTVLLRQTKLCALNSLHSVAVCEKSCIFAA